MFERFTDRARHVIVLAQEEARRLRHDYIGTEHILLGVAGEREGVAARILLDFDADPETVGNEVMRALGSPQGRAHEPSPHKPRIVILCCPSCGSGIVETMGTHEPPNSLQAKGEGDLECPNCSTQWTAEWSVRMTRR